MSIDLISEEIFPISSLPARLPPITGRGDRLRRISVQTVYRWSSVGVRGQRLETVQVGSVRCTSMNAYRRFVAALTAARDAQPAAERSPSAMAEKRHARMQGALDALGV